MGDVSKEVSQGKGRMADRQSLVILHKVSVHVTYSRKPSGVQRRVLIARPQSSIKAVIQGHR